MAFLSDPILNLDWICDGAIKWHSVAGIEKLESSQI